MQRGLILVFLVSTSCPATYADFRSKFNIIVQTETQYAKSAYAADLDGDGDLDVLWTSYLDEQIAWHENE